MDSLNRVNTLLFQTAEQAVILFMGIIALVIPYEVFGRYVLGDMPMWSGESATYSLVWVSMLGGAVGLRKGVQVGVDLAYAKLAAHWAGSISRRSRRNKYIISKKLSEQQNVHCRRRVFCKIRPSQAL